MNTSKFVIMLTSLVVMALLVGAVFLPVVSSSTTRTVTTIEENEEPGWSRYAYTQTDDYSFGISIEDDTLNIGSQGIGIQTGELYDMMVLSTDVLTIVVDGDTLVAITENGAVDLGTSVNVAKTSSGLTVGESTYSAPLWSYYPSATGKYAYFDHADLLTDGKPLSVWGNFAGVLTYNGIDTSGYGFVLDATVTDGVIEGAVWNYEPGEVEPIEDIEEPFNPGSLNPLDPSIIDTDPFNPDEPSAEIQNADPTNGTRIGDLYYTFSGTNATVIGYSSSINWSTFTTIPDTVTDGGVTYNVTRIGASAFKDCTNLALTSLPSGITYIDSQAFSRCTSLALTSLPNGITNIESSGFYNCTNLALTSLPSSLQYLKQSAFTGCTSLALTSLPSGVKTIQNGVFNGCTSLALTSLPSGVSIFGSSVFYGCVGITSFVWPSDITTIPSSTFNNCANLTDITIPNTVTSIGSSAFRNCTSLALTSLPDAVTNIDTYAFDGCTSLALTSLPSGVTSIGERAFQNCTNLAITYVNANLGQNAFSGCTGIPYLVFDCNGKTVGSFIISGTTFTDMVITGNPSYGTATIFTGSNLEEVLNIGGGDSSGRGFGTATVQDYIDASGYIAPLSLAHHEQVAIESPTTDVINILPLVAGIGLLLIGLGVFITRRI